MKTYPSRHANTWSDVGGLVQNWLHFKNSNANEGGSLSKSRIKAEDNDLQPKYFSTYIQLNTEQTSSYQLELMMSCGTLPWMTPIGPMKAHADFFRSPKDSMLTLSRHKTPATYPSIHPTNHPFLQSQIAGRVQFITKPHRTSPQALSTLTPTIAIYSMLPWGNVRVKELVT